jgi:flagellar basal-body rod modification protein FlgD
MNFHGISTITPLAQTMAGSSAKSANSANSSTSAADDAQSTFISLLVTELKAQDPTQPMDPTQMVAQMFSMNQLQQLISINETLTNAFGPHN